MKMQEFKEGLTAEFAKDNTLALDMFEDHARITCPGNVEQKPELFDSIGGCPFTAEELEYFWRSWLFEAECEDGTYKFLLWDCGNGHYVFQCDFTLEDVKNLYQSIIKNSKTS